MLNTMIRQKHICKASTRRGKASNGHMYIRMSVAQELLLRVAVLICVMYIYIAFVMKETK